MNARDELVAEATPARDELLEYLRDAELPNTYYHQDDGYGTPAIRPATSSEAAEMALDVVEAAGWSKPRTVNNAAELDALPTGSVVWTRAAVGTVGHVFVKCAGKWVIPWRDTAEDPLEPNGSVTVLFPPGDRQIVGTTSAFGPWMSDEQLRKQRLRPMSEVMGEVLKDANLKLELKPPTTPIPYDEMRRLCGLPDVRGYVVSREFARMGKQLGGVFQRVAEAWTEGVNKALPGLQAFAESAQPKQGPPMWAVDPAHSRRTRNRATDIRTPYR